MLMGPETTPNSSPGDTGSQTAPSSSPGDTAPQTPSPSLPSDTIRSNFGTNPAGSPTKACDSPTKPEVKKKPKPPAPRKTPTIKATTGTGPADVALVRAQVDKIPTWILNWLINSGYSWIVPNDNVTNAFPGYKGQKPPKWEATLPGATWDRVPGMLNDQTKQIAVSTVNHQIATKGHHSENLALHETGHALGRLTNQNGVPLYKSPQFLKAWNEALKDVAHAGIRLDSYFSNPERGFDEMFAEGFARYFDGGEKATYEFSKPGWRKIRDYFDTFFNDPGSLGLK
jgi:hypothetical protein